MFERRQEKKNETPVRYCLAFFSLLLSFRVSLRGGSVPTVFVCTYIVVFHLPFQRSREREKQKEIKRETKRNKKKRNKRKRKCPPGLLSFSIPNKNIE